MIDFRYLNVSQSFGETRRPLEWPVYVSLLRASATRNQPRDGVRSWENPMHAQQPRAKPYVLLTRCLGLHIWTFTVSSYDRRTRLLSLKDRCFMELVQPEVLRNTMSGSSLSVDFPVSLWIEDLSA
jgi:hypothetical protein